MKKRAIVSVMFLAILFSSITGLSQVNLDDEPELSQRSIDMLNDVIRRTETCREGMAVIAVFSVATDVLYAYKTARGGAGAVATGDPTVFGREQIARWLRGRLHRSPDTRTPNAWDAVAALSEACRQTVRSEVGIFKELYSDRLTQEERDFWDGFLELFDRPGLPVITGRSHGDPHLVTYDGTKYSFQTVGEFVLTRNRNLGFEVQTRQSRVTHSLSLNSAVSMNVCGDIVSIYLDAAPDSDTSTPLRINNKPHKIPEKSLKLRNGGVVQGSPNRLIVRWPTGENVIVNIYARSERKYLDVVAQTFKSKRGRMEGLLGNTNGIPSDDLKLSNGRTISTQSSYVKVSQLLGGSKMSNSFATAQKLYLKKLAKDFGDSWRVSESNSLFSYQAGQGTKTFSDRGFPLNYHSLSDLNATQIQNAKAVCEKERVRPENLESCVFDVAFSNYDSFAESTARLSEVNDILRSIGLKSSIRVPDLKSEATRKIESKVKAKIPGTVKQKIKLPF